MRWQRRNQKQQQKQPRQAQKGKVTGQIVLALDPTEGGAPTGSNKAVGQSLPLPSTTTSDKQIVQADPMGDQPSNDEQNVGGESVGNIFLSFQGGSEEVIGGVTTDKGQTQ